MLNTKEELWVKRQVMAEERGASSAASAGYPVGDTPQERIDAAIDSVLRAAGSALKNYTMQLTLDRMRDAMRKIMSDSYISGSNAAHSAMMESQKG